MLTENYIEKFNSNLPKIIDEDTYINIIRLDNNLYRFNIINRIAFEVVHNKNLFDLKSKEEWFELGRKVIDLQDYIDVLLPMYKTYYRDTYTNEIVDIKEFSSDELKKAIELKVIYKDEELSEFTSHRLYDIRNTSNIDKESKYIVPKPIFNIKIYFDIINSLTGITVAESEDIVFFSDKEKVLYICRDSYENTLCTLTDCLVSFMLKHPDDYITNNKGIFIDIESKRVNRLIVESIKFKILSLLGIINKNDVIVALRQSGVSSYEDLMDILMIVDELSLNILNKIKFTDNNVNNDVISNITKIKKVDLLLNILQANSIHSKIEGN